MIYEMYLGVARRWLLVSGANTGILYELSF